MASAAVIDVFSQYRCLDRSRQEIIFLEINKVTAPDTLKSDAEIVSPTAIRTDRQAGDQRVTVKAMIRDEKDWPRAIRPAFAEEVKERRPCIAVLIATGDDDGYIHSERIT